MKIAELLEPAFIVNGDTLSGNVLEEYKDELMKCPQFQDVTEIEVVNLPGFEVDLPVAANGTKAVVAATMKMSESIRFQGKLYLYSFRVSAPIYDPNYGYNPNKKASLSPIVYSPDHSEPFRNLKIELWQDKLEGDLESYKRDLHILLDDILDNPKEYEPPTKRGLLIRMYCENVETIALPEEERETIIQFETIKQ